MVVKYVTVNEGFRLATEHQVGDIYCEPKFVEIINESFNVKSLCIVAFDNEKPLLGLVLYSKGKSIVQPTTYIYTGIWKTSKSSILLENAFIAIIKKIQSDYRFISVLLPPKITDIRPFIYCGFKADVKYTYVNNLTNIVLSSDVKSMRNRATNLGIDFQFGSATQEVLEQNIASFFNLGYKKRYINTLEKLIVGLTSEGYFRPISARLNGELLASGYVLLDKVNRHAMNLFITSNKSHYKTGVHSSLYLHNLYWLRDTGFLTNDLLGATTKGIGNFKSNFNGELTPYYHVRYNYLRWKVVKVVNIVKNLLMKLNAK